VGRRVIEYIDPTKQTLLFSSGFENNQRKLKVCDGAKTAIAPRTLRVRPCYDHIAGSRTDGRRNISATRQDTLTASSRAPNWGNRRSRGRPVRGGLQPQDRQDGLLSHLGCRASPTKSSNKTGRCRPMAQNVSAMSVLMSAMMMNGPIAGSAFRSRLTHCRPGPLTIVATQRSRCNRFLAATPQAM
jgi:hypothetical protein